MIKYYLSVVHEIPVVNILAGEIRVLLGCGTFNQVIPTQNIGNIAEVQSDRDKKLTKNQGCILK
uniref:Uncharacterized protein n=1 Tax=Romanomermis culicivorax TaxID=13658 RepID=A0A915JVK1_ROMCU